MFFKWTKDPMLYSMAVIALIQGFIVEQAASETLSGIWLKFAPISSGGAYVTSAPCFSHSPQIENVSDQLELYGAIREANLTITQALFTLIPKLPRASLPRKPSAASSNAARDPYDLRSCGQDKLPDTADDIGSW